MSEAETDSTEPHSLPPWRVLASKTLIEDRWLRVRAETCLTADGVEISPYYVLDFPDWALVVALDQEDHIVLVEQYRHGLGEVSTELPCGGVDIKDAGPLEAGKRELREETGYGGGEWTYIARLSPNPANHSNACHVILATNVRPLGGRCDDATEKLRVLRRPVAEAVELATQGGVVQAMHVAAMALALGRIGKWTANQAPSRRSP